VFLRESPLLSGLFFFLRKRVGESLVPIFASENKERYIMETDDNFEDPPDISDFHGNKRELIKRGLERGKLSWKEIEAALPPEHTSATEREVLLFTLKSLRVKVSGKPAHEK